MMNTEQILLEKWRVLPAHKQAEVIDFADFLADQMSKNNQDNSEVKTESNLEEYPNPKEQVKHDINNYRFKTPLAQKMWELRQNALSKGEIKLLDWEGIEKEVTERRGQREWH